MGYFDGDHMGGLGFFGMVFSLLLAVAIWVSLLVLLVRRFAAPWQPPHADGGQRQDGAEELLRLRFARGEIDAKQLADMRDALAEDRARH